MKKNRRVRGERRVGLARALSKLGLCSRSQAADLIRAGRVRLNGNLRTDPETPVAMHRDRIDVDGRAIQAAHAAYLMMNKPKGIITSAADGKGLETVYSLLRGSEPWVAPVGRLDKASEGLLLFTNDSAWGARISDPASHLDKTYHVHVAGLRDERIAQALVQGVDCAGEQLRAKDARVLRTGERNTWFEIVLDEGKNRQIRRMLERLGIEVIRLVRIAIGPLPLGTLEKGKVRTLTPAEIAALDEATKRSKKGLETLKVGSRTGPRSV